MWTAFKREKKKHFSVSFSKKKNLLNEMKVYFQILKIFRCISSWLQKVKVEILFQVFLSLKVSCMSARTVFYFLCHCYRTSANWIPVLLLSGLDLKCNIIPSLFYTSLELKAAFHRYRPLGRTKSGFVVKMLWKGHTLKFSVIINHSHSVA